MKKSLTHSNAFQKARKKWKENEKKIKKGKYGTLFLIHELETIVSSK